MNVYLKRDKLRYERFKRGFTLEEMVEEFKREINIEITKQFLGAIERGERNPKIKDAKLIADYFGYSIEELFF
ncbi:MAG: helix-turn-helix transcriptional regulator [archaeon]